MRLRTDEEEQEAAARQFADWAHVQGYTNNPAVSREAIEGMAKAWIAGAIYGLVRALSLTDEEVTS